MGRTAEYKRNTHRIRRLGEYTGLRVCMLVSRLVPDGTIAYIPIDFEFSAALPVVTEARARSQMNVPGTDNN